MSGQIIYTPATGADWATAWEQAEYTRKGKFGLSLTNYNNTSLPAIASGSWCEVAGSIYKWTSEEAISGSLSSSAVNYIKLVPSGSGDTAIVTATWTTSAPTWSDAYQGYYSGTSRYVGGCYYTGSLYELKWVYNPGEYRRCYNSSSIFVDTCLDIGDWDMDSTASKSVAHGCPLSLIIELQGSVRDDDGTVLYALSFGSAATSVAVSIYCDATNVILDRASGTFFDGVLFNATGFNRGWIIVTCKI